jgi:hypothetical protein
VLAKRPCLLFLALAALIAIGAGGAAAREQILKTKLALEHGQQDLRVERAGTIYVYRISTTGTGFVCHAVRNGNLVSLKAARPRPMPSSMGCSCGTKCWKDREAKMSICVCRTCDNRGGWIEIESMPSP